MAATRVDGDEALGSLSRLSVDGVRAWLREKVCADERIQELFVLNGIDGKALQSLGDAELLAMGVETEETRRRILSARSAASSSAAKTFDGGRAAGVEFLQVEQQGAMLGRGHFGHVCRGSLNGTPVALKGLSEATEAEFFSEVQVFKELHNPNVIQFFGIANRPSLFMVMELADGSVLNLVREKELDQKTLVSFARDCAAGMEYLSSKRIIHRDLAARNLLFFRTGTGYTVKVSDFGLSRFCLHASGSPYYRAQYGSIPLKWTAPEAFRDGRFTEKSDVWSFGVVLWELFSHGAEPYGVSYKTEVEMLALLACSRLEPPVGCDPGIVQVMQSCWLFDPDRRPTFEMLRRQLSPQCSGGACDSAPHPQEASGYSASLNRTDLDVVSRSAPRQQQPFAPRAAQALQAPQAPRTPMAGLYQVPRQVIQQPVCTLDFNSEQTKGLEGIRNIIAALRMHAANAGVCTSACAALKNLAVNGTNRASIGREGGITSIIAVLKTHAANAGVCKEACAALESLAVNNEENSALIACEGGVPLIIAALKTHAENAGVCNSACAALWKLAVIDDIASLISHEDGVALITAALISHATHAGVCSNACGALKVLSANDENGLLIELAIDSNPALAQFRSRVFS